MTERFRWEIPLLAAYLEIDLEKVAEQVEAAETAIFLGMRELANSLHAQQESEALQRATEHLLHIKTDKLGWPRLN